MPGNKRKKLIVVLVIAIIAGITVLMFHESESTETFPPDGPYPVSVKVLDVEFEGRLMPVMVWYPKPESSAGPYVYNTKIKGAAGYDSPTPGKGAPYPMIVFSHGIGECGCMSVYYTENLASHGYVVVAPDHEDSMMCHIKGEPDISFGELSVAAVKSLGDLYAIVEILFKDYLEERDFDFSYRPREIKTVIDRALKWNSDPASFLYGMIDPEKIGMTGHSLGGFTSLAIGGLPFHCGGSVDEEKCASANKGIESVDTCCIESIAKMEDPLQLSDSRVKAILPMGPAVFFPELEKAATELRVPMMIITGDDKRAEVPWEPVSALYENAPAPKFLIRLKSTDHMTIADFLTTRGITRPLFAGYRFNFEDKAQVYKDYSVAFFDLYLKGDDLRSKILSEPSNRFVELWRKSD